MKNKISVAIATYNGESYITEQLQSILLQRTPVDEVIISDDCSNDSTVDIANRVLRNTSVTFKVIINNNNIGYTQNFFQAISECSGDIIFLADQDDMWHPNKTTKVIDHFIQSNAGILIHDVEICDEKLVKSGETKLQRLRSLGYSDDKFVAGMATVITKEFWNKCRPLPVKDNPYWTYDSWLHKCGHLLNERVVLEDTLALYRRHNNAVTISSEYNSFINPSRLRRDPTKKITCKYDKLCNMKKNILKYDHLVKWITNTMTDDTYRSLLDNQLYIYNKLLKDSKKRLEVYESTFLKRFPKSVVLYLRGGYNSFSGIKSCLKDAFSL